MAQLSRTSPGECAPEDQLRMGTPRGRLVLATTIVGSDIALLDGTVVNVALPTIGRELDADLTGLQWVVNAYALTLAALILLGGSLGDRFGRARLYAVGVAGFGVASLACGLAPTIEMLVAALTGADYADPGALAPAYRNAMLASAALVALGAAVTAVGLARREPECAETPHLDVAAR